MITNDTIYRYFSCKKDAENFLDGTLILRSSYFYEILEYAGDIETGDANERTISGHAHGLGASTYRSFIPKYLACFSNLKNWKKEVFWVEINSSREIYQLVKERISDKFKNEKPIIGGNSKCGDVIYLNEQEMHEWNTKRLEEKKNPQNNWLEIKRNRYQFQEEWRIVFEGAWQSDGSPLGDVMNIDPDTLLGRFIKEQKKEAQDNILNGCREIRLNLGNIEKIARLLD